MEFEIYPNATDGLLYIENSKKPIAAIKVFDVAGAELLYLPFGQKNWIDFFHLKSGNYFIQLIDNSQDILETKMIIKY